MDLQLKNKLSLVTGSTAGIGYAIAELLSAEGADVIINGRSQAAVEQAIEKLTPQALGTLHRYAGDLSTAEAAAQIAEKFPNVEILINNLGVFEPKPFEEIPDGDWRRFFEVNVLSGVRLSRLYLPGMKARNWGRIVFISSESAVQIPAE